MTSSYLLQPLRSPEKVMLAALDRCEHVGDVMSNFDHKIKRDLDVGQCGDYPAWNFHGTVWRDERGYHCKVMRYQSLAAIIDGDTLQEIMDKACEEWGSD